MRQCGFQDPLSFVVSSILDFLVDRMATCSPLIQLTLVLGYLALLTGCGGGSPATVRLIDEIASAKIASPLSEAPALESVLADLKLLPEREPGSPICPQCTASGDTNCRLDNEGVLHCGLETGSFGLNFAIPAPSSGYTAIVFDVRSQHAGCVGLEIWDEAQRMRMTLPMVDSADWQSVPVVWASAPNASRVLMRLLRRRIAEPCRLAVRSVTSFELESDYELSLALLRARHPALGIDHGLGIARHGTFLPLADAKTVRPPFDDNFGSRETLLAPVPTNFRFRVRIPHRGRLLFSYGLSRESRIGDLVNFEILVTGEDGLERRLWSDRLELTPENWHWHEAVVPLDDVWGQTTELTLRTRSPTNQGFALWGTPTIDVPRHPDGPPNIILIAVDTLRADRLSAYGYPEVTSPRIDAFAKDGVLFETAISQSNWTIPSFAAIFTGRIVARHQLATFVQRLAPSTPTLAQILREHGWRTRAIIYHPALYNRLDQGFEVHFNVPKSIHLADENLRTALNWIRKIRDQRFFLFLHFSDPHQPFSQPDEFVPPASSASLRRFGFQLPLFIGTEFQKCESCMSGVRVAESAKSLARNLYDGEIRYVDDRIGRFFDELRELKLYEDAVIAFVSDHGESLWSHREFYAHGGTSQYNELIRVPLIIKPAAGDRYRRGAVVKTRVRAFDLMPTLLELAGIQLEEDELDARSLLPFLRSTNYVEIGRDRVAFSQSSASAALLNGRWKYIMPVGKGTDRANPRKPALRREVLYDLEHDPEEQNECSAEFPQIFRSMRETALEYLLRTVGGHFLLVLGDPAAVEQRLLVTCDPACSWDPLLQFGLERVTRAAADTAVFEGHGLGGGIRLFARFSSEPYATLSVSWAGEARGEPAESLAHLAVKDAIHFEEGLVGGLSRQPGPSAWILEAPDRMVVGKRTVSKMDLQQEEALRALGYLR